MTPLISIVVPVFNEQGTVAEVIERLLSIDLPAAREILVELGRRGMVGGQEDMIEDTAINLARARGQAA